MQRALKKAHKTGKSEFRKETIMMNKLTRGILKFLAQIIIVTILLVGVQIIMDGMCLLGLPEMDEVQSVSVA